MSYEAAYRRWQEDPEGYWAERAELVTWDRPWDRVLDSDRPPFYRWFPGAELNTCRNCLDRHVEAGHGERLALIHDSPVTDSKKSFTYAELLDLVARAAGAFRACGVAKGDRVLIYMPMVPEAVVAMLASARIGAVHSVVFGGFAAPELAARIDDVKPTIVVAGSCGIEPSRVVAYKPMLDRAIDMASHKPEHCLIFQRSMERASMVSGRDLDWVEETTRAAPVECVSVKATDPLYILHTSGTTGMPKGIVRDNGGHAVALTNTMEMVYGIKPGETFWAASDIGWVVGHSYIVYAPLLAGCTSVIYEGKPVGTPDAGAFWRVIEEHSVAALFTAPTAFRAIRREDPEAKLLARHDLSRFRTLFLAGERADPPTVSWAEEKLGVPVLDHWWQTETGWPITGYFRGLGLFGVKHGSAGKPSPGFDLAVVDESGKPLPAGEIGSLVAQLPLPPGCTPTLWGDEERFRHAYLEEFSDCYSTADAGIIDENGYVWVMARTDDIINCAGHRLSTGAMEEILAGHPDVVECAVVGVADELKGQVPLGFLVLNTDTSTTPDEVAKATVLMVREAIGAVAAYRTSIVVSRLPKTRSGKILRKVIAALAEGREATPPPTIEDPAVVGEIEIALKAVSIPAH